MAPKFKDPDDQIPCASPAQLSAHIVEMQTLFLKAESEHTWESFGKSLNKLAALTRGGAFKLDNFQSSVGSVAQGGVGEKIVQCVLSERAALSKPAVELVTAIATCLTTHFTERLQRLYIPALLDLIRRTNNIVRERAEHSLCSIIRACPLPSLITYLSTPARDVNAKLRRAVTAACTLAVDGWKAGGKVDDVEGMIKILTVDKDADVRKSAKDLWDRYKVTWPERVLSFIGPMSPMTKKRLDIRETDTYPLTASGSMGRSPSASNLSSPAASEPAAVPVKKMGAKSFIAQKKAELARQRAAESRQNSVEPGGSDDGASPARSATAPSTSTLASPVNQAPLPPSPTQAGRPSNILLPNFETNEEDSPSLLSQLPPLPPSQPPTPHKQVDRSSSVGPSPLAAPDVAEKSSPSRPVPPSPTPSPAPLLDLGRSTPLRPARSPARAQFPPDPFSPQTPSSASGPSTPAQPTASSSKSPLAGFPTPAQPPTLQSRALRNAAAFQNSPAPGGSQGGARRMRDLLSAASGSNGEFGEWTRWNDKFADASPSVDDAARLDLDALTDLSDEGTVRRVVAFSRALETGGEEEVEGRLVDLDLDGKDREGVWREGGLFEGLLEKVLAALKKEDTAAQVENLLTILQSLIHHQWSLFEGHESALFSTLLSLRPIARLAVRQATTSLFTLVTDRLSPIFCLYTLSSTLRGLVPDGGSEEGGYEGEPQGFGFGLLELGRCMMRLPGEVVSEELPRLRDLILPGLYSLSLMVRESAATAVLAAQLVIRDETLVFSLLEGLTSEKINLLTYLFEKNRIRDQGVGSEGGEGRERVEREMRRLSLRP